MLKMLYITRKKNESVIVNNTIKIEVVETKNNKVKLGFTFPEGSSILRSELFEKITNANQTSVEIDLEKLDIFKKNK